SPLPAERKRRPQKPPAPTMNRPIADSLPESPWRTARSDLTAACALHCTRSIPSAMASQEIEALTQALARLPGLGPRSARRAVLHLLKRREAALTPLLRALERVADALAICSVCGNVDTIDPCTVCADTRRD